MIPEDRFTSTVADAAAYERYRSLNDDSVDDDYDRYDAMADADEEEDYDSEDEGPCCNDFSCPCGG